MSGIMTPNDDSLAPADLERVIALCERFERAWNEGRAERIEDLQNELPGPLRPRLFRELLALEVELRQRRGERPRPDEYLFRFADRAGSIAAIFADAGDTGSWPSGPSTMADRFDDNAPLDTLSGSGPVAATHVASPGQSAVDGQITDEFDSVGRLEETKVDAANTAGQGISTEATPGEAGVAATGPPAWETQPYTPPPAGSSSWVGVAGYELLTEIGRGGMGTVYKARHRALKRLVALKLIQGGVHARPERLGRLRTEAEALARLNHENIVQVYDVGEINGEPFVALELLEGGTLAAKLAGTPQPDQLAATISRTLARAIHAAHQVGIVHRDLKPLNVLLDETGRFKIADFGLAKILGDRDEKTVSGVPLGTPSYMAPEQADGRSHQVGPAADIYALGAILYEMLTGRPPFKGPSGHATILQVIHDEPVPPSRLQPHVSRDLETICLKCLEKEPRRRYVSAADLADDLDRALKGWPILARRVPAWEVGFKWARRHPTRTTLAALALAACVVLAATGIWYQEDLRRRGQVDSTRLARRILEGTSKLFKGQDELASGRPVEAKLTLSNLLTEIQDEPQRLADLRGRALALLPQADAVIAREKADAARQAAVEQARERYHQFRTEKDNALYHETQFAGLDQSASRDATRVSAEAALAVFGTPRADGGWSLGPLPASLSEAERRDVEEGCYVLLLILAGVEDRPDQGLRHLVAADRLRHPTRAYQRRLADCLARQGHHDSAERARLEGERLTPETAFDHFLTGLEPYRQRRWTMAIGHFDVVLRLQPDHFWAHALSAVCCLQPELKRPEQAKVHLTACLQREPRFAWLYVLRAFASYQATVLARDAAKERAAQRDAPPTETGADFAPAEADYRTAGDLLAETPNPELHYILLINRGLLRLERGEWDGAVGDLEAAIQLNSRHYLAYANLAQVYQRQGKTDEAIAKFGQALAVQPDLAALYRGRAEVELNRKDPTPEQRAQALADFDQAIRLETLGNPVLARDQTSRARLFFQDHDDVKALAACDAALVVVPDYPEAHLLRVRALLNLKRYKDALGSCDALLIRGKPSAEVYEMRQRARERLDDFAGAIEDVTQALSLQPGQSALLVRRGNLYLVEDSPLLALRDFQEAVRLAPSLAEARAGLGIARVRLGRFRDAVVDAETAARLGPIDYRVLFKAARIYVLAAVAATSKVRRNGPVTVALVTRYQDRAVALVRDAWGRVPAAERATLEEALRTDRAFRPILRRLRFLPPAEPTGQVSR